MKRKFDGEFMVSMKELRECVRKENPDADEETIETLAREKRNFNNKHLRAYLRGNQISFFKKDKFNRKKPFVV